MASVGYCAAFSKTADAIKSDVNTQVDSGKKAVADQKAKLKAVEEILVDSLIKLEIDNQIS